MGGQGWEANVVGGPPAYNSRGCAEAYINGGLLDAKAVHQAGFALLLYGLDRWPAP